MSRVPTNCPLPTAALGLELVYLVVEAPESLCVFRLHEFHAALGVTELLLDLSQHPRHLDYTVLGLEDRNGLKHGLKQVTI